MKVSSQTRPELLSIEHTWNNKIEARFTENVEEVIDSEDNSTCFIYDEYIYSDNYSNQLAATICQNRDYYLKLAKEQEKYSGLTPFEIAKKILEETTENNE